MECDNVTFLGAGKAAIWSIDAYDNILNAWEIPNGACAFGGGGEPNPVTGRMTGGGSIQGTSVRHGMALHCDATEGPNNLEVNWGKGERFHLDSLDSVACSDDASIEANPPAAGFDTMVGTGTGSYDGVAGATIRFTFTDAGEPGKLDVAKIAVVDAGGTTVLDVGGNLQNGNQQAHAD